MRLDNEKKICALTNKIVSSAVKNRRKCVAIVHWTLGKKYFWAPRTKIIKFDRKKIIGTKVRKKKKQKNRSLFVTFCSFSAVIKRDGDRNLLIESCSLTLGESINEISGSRSSKDLVAKFQLLDSNVVWGQIPQLCSDFPAFFPKITHF